MTAPTVRTRLLGVDRARFVALAGMVLVHAQSDLVLPPLEAAASAADVSAPWYLHAVQALCTNPARLLFLLLAGVGVSLLVKRRGPSTSTLLRRAGFLAAVGLVLLALGWTDLVLLFYAVLFVLAPALLRLPARGLLGVAVLTAVPALVATAVDPGRAADLTGVLLVVGEAVPLFCVGMAVGCLDLTDARAAHRLTATGALLAVAACLHVSHWPSPEGCR